jgi:hypothetical protein
LGVVGWLLGFYTAMFEEVSEECGGFGLQHAAVCGEGMVEACVGGGVMEGTGVPGLPIWGGVDEAREAGGVGCSGAHGAGLQGRVEGAADEAPGAEMGGGPPDGQEFGVGGGISLSLAFVGGDGQDLCSPGDDGAHGGLALSGGFAGGREGPAHHGEVLFGVLFKFSRHAADNSREMVWEAELPMWGLLGR